MDFVRPASFSLLLLLAFACRPESGSEKFVLFTNFDEVARWGNAPASFSNEKARSGFISLKGGGGVEFSAMYKVPLAHLAPFLPRKVAFKGWAYFPSGRVGVSYVVMQIVRADPSTGQDVWEGVPINLQVKRFGTWAPVSGEVRFPEGLSKSDEFRLYLWQPEQQGEAFYLDDLHLTFLP